MFIRSKRLFLRPGWSEDRNQVAAICAMDPVVLDTFGATRDETRAPRFLVTLPHDRGSTIVGMCGLTVRCGRAQAWAWIAPRYRGRGYEAEARAATRPLAASLGHAVDGEDDDSVPMGGKFGFEPQARTAA